LSFHVNELSLYDLDYIAARPGILKSISATLSPPHDQKAPKKEKGAVSK